VSGAASAARDGHAAGDAGAPPAPREALDARARVLVEALPYLQVFRGAIVVVKYGGAAMGDPALADSWARDVVLLEHVGIRPLVVHGGGPALTRTMERMGIESRFVEGHRVTSAESAEIAEMVLSGRINKDVVARLNRAGARAIGLSGTDAGMLRVERHRPSGLDIGYVGAVSAVDTEPLLLLLEKGYTPVLSSTAADRDGHPLNINADLVAGAIAGALRAAKLVFLSDVPGLLVEERLAEVVESSEARALLGGADVSGGMRPKLEAALAALAAGVPRVHLVDGRVRHALLLEIFTDHGVGTLLVPDGARGAMARDEARR
jgi:acetylglutamate kinase